MNKPVFNPALPFHVIVKPKFNPNHPHKVVDESFEIPKPEPPKTTLNETLSPEGKDFLAKKYPALAQALDGQELPMDSKQAHETIKNAVSKGEEALIRGKNPIEAQQVVLGEFKRSLGGTTP